MNPESLSPTSVYHYPRYYAIGYQWNTSAECDFLEACVRRYGAAPIDAHPGTLLDIGCGAGRHLLEMARRGYQATGFDLRPEMVQFVQDASRTTKIPVTVSVGDLRAMQLQGTFILAVCLMDTFRYLLTNEEIVRHLQEVGRHLAPGGLYVTDFWIPTQWDQLANEIYQWEQTEHGTTVRVFYVQHPESADPISQTFEDELVFVVDDEGQTKEIHGERVRTRLIMPQEFRALIDASGMFDLKGVFADFDVEKPLKSPHLSWRMVSVLQKRPAP